MYMANENSHTDNPVGQKLRRFIQELLDDGSSAEVISFNLARASAGLGLDIAPDPQIAMAVVMDGIRAACASRSATTQNQENSSEIDQAFPINATIH
jgi:hypothetical protein